MNKASKTLLIIGGILGIIAAIVMGIIFLVSALGTALVSSVDGTVVISETGATTTQVVDASAIAGVLGGFTTFLGIYALLLIVSAIICFVSNGVKSTGLYITCIVLGVCTCSIFALLGGIFGVVSNKQSE